MPRKAREKSGTGIYHVMLRGINHQDIFEERSDYWKFLKLLRLQTHPEDKQGHPLPPHCIVYAYCLMTNHVHLLLRELDEGFLLFVDCRRENAHADGAICHYNFYYS